ncbi:uncharacterized protein LOC112456554 [Temnothorax curvispinosus]|uniref:Uncharacterized protein LOC112456554 n=1 Tax=Temnothorax curvispinosus TaxID=300111 RepID=A0A6J1PYJ8_9HYME|nr:uncharacterized protein LOC112456554 [Temnothorax curvispinosus]
MAEALASKERVRISRPTMTADIRLSGFEESVAETEICKTVALKRDTGITNVTVGPIRRMANGLCSTVVKCPLAVANVFTKKGKVALGWSSAKVVMLDKRPLQCFKYLEFEHTRATCRNEADRTGAYYRCGEDSHSARDCQVPVRCVVCLGKGLPHEHRIGGPSCKRCKQGKRDKAAEKERGEAAKSGEGTSKAKGKSSAKPKKILKVKV